MVKNISMNISAELRQKEFKHLLFKNAFSFHAKEIINKMLDWKYSGEKLDKKTIQTLMTNVKLVAKISKNDKTFIELLTKQPELINDSKTKAFAIAILIGYNKTDSQGAKRLLPIFGLDKVPDELPDNEHIGLSMNIQKGSR